MAISDSQKIDSLYKKLLFGVAKTDTGANKSPSNESIASPLLLRGDLIWGESASIPATPPQITTSIVAVYNDSLASTIRTTMDATATTNRTWKTGLTNWIPPEFGAQYSVKVYASVPNSTTPQTSGTMLPPDGTGNSDSYLFDYQSGVLNFPDSNLPSALSNKIIYIVGYRYVGNMGSSSVLVQYGGTPIGSVTALNFSTGTTATIVNNVATLSVVTSLDTLQTITDRGFTTTNSMHISSVVSSTSTSTGALIVAGGAGIGGDIWATGRINSESLKIADSVFDSTMVLVNTSVATVIDTYSVTEFRSAKYLVQIDDGEGINANFQVIEILLLIDNSGTVYATEYGMVTSNGELGDFTADVQVDNKLRLYFTANTATNKLIRVLRTAMTV